MGSASDNIAQRDAIKSNSTLTGGATFTLDERQSNYFSQMLLCIPCIRIVLYTKSEQNRTIPSYD